MGKVDPNKYGSKTDKLTVEDLEGDAAVLTIAGFGEKVFTDIEGSTTTRKVTPFLTFRETEDKVLWLNATQVGYLVERLGDDSDDWEGQPVPVERHEYETFRGQKGVNLWISPPERWDDLLAQAGHGRKAAPKKKASGVKARRK